VVREEILLEDKWNKKHITDSDVEQELEARLSVLENKE